MCQLFSGNVKFMLYFLKNVDNKYEITSLKVKRKH